MSPFTSLKNWSRRLQVLEVERMDDASVEVIILSVNPPSIHELNNISSASH